MGQPKVTVIGAGITGLVAAHRLTARSVRVRLFEKTARTGGVIRSERIAADHSDGSWLVEHGPNSLLDNGGPHAAALRHLIDELGLAPQVLPANPQAKARYLVRDARPLPVPTSPLALARSPLLSASATWSLLRELFRRRPKSPRSTDIPLSHFIADHFCQEIVDYLLNPFVSGVYAGDPEKLSAQHAFPALWHGEQSHGSLLRAQIATARARRKRGEKRGGLLSFHDGLQTLTDALTRALPPETLQLNTHVRALRRATDGSTWKIETDQGEEAANAVISALPAYALSALRIGEEMPLASLAEIEHPPLSTLFLGYRREQVSHPLDGFGLLVPAIEQLPLLGVIFASTLFPDRAPQGHVALHVMIGGTAQAALTTLPLDSLLARIYPALAQLLGLRGEPCFIHHGTHAHAIPQYNLRYERHLALMADCETRAPGLFIGGQCRDGISTPACITSGERLAARTLAMLGE